jgi:asparagine synthetase B (glutamine-hydrolysing)
VPNIFASEKKCLLDHPLIKRCERRRLPPNKLYSSATKLAIRPLAASPALKPQITAKLAIKSKADFLEVFEAQGITGLAIKYGE